MKKSENEKKFYSFPMIKRIQLDNEISLVLDSTPPFGHDETRNKAPEFMKNDPYKA